jgi:hypothetical protein
VVLRLSWSKVVPAKASFTLLKRKKLAGAKSGEEGRCSYTWIPFAAIHFFALVAVWTGVFVPAEPPLLLGHGWVLLGTIWV